MAGAGINAPKIFALEGEFAMTEGHAQELKTQALAMQVGKRMRIYLSDNNAGIDDALHGGVIPKAYADQYDLVAQWTSYGWNVFTSDDGGDYAKVVELLQAMENSDASDKRPVIAIAKTTKGYWPTAKDGKLGGAAHITGYKSHPYGYKMNSEYFVAMASTFEEKYGVKFAGIRDGAPKTEKERIVQFKTNIDVVMSVFEQKGLGDWVADRLVALGDSVKDNEKVQFAEGSNPFLDERLKVASLPVEAQKVTATNRISGATKEVAISLFKKPGEMLGARRAISEIIKYMNYVTDNRFVTLAADLSESINVEHGALWGHYDPVTNPLGTMSALSSTAQEIETAGPRLFPIAADRIFGFGETRTEFRAVLPDGWHAQLPHNVDASSVFGKYHSEYVQSGRELVLTRTITGAAGIYPPDQLKTLLRWLREIAKDDAKLIVIDTAPASTRSGGNNRSK